MLPSWSVFLKKTRSSEKKIQWWKTVSPAFRLWHFPASRVSEPVKIKIIQDKRYKNDAHDNKGTYGYHIQFIRKEEPATLHIGIFTTVNIYQLPSNMTQKPVKT
jgi:hypothetical protein